MDEQKEEQQKQLMLKAKLTINKLKNDLGQCEIQLQSEKEKSSKLEKLLNSFIEESHSVKWDQIEKILTRVRVEEVEWWCIKLKNQIEWIRFEELNNQKDEIPEILKILEQSQQILCLDETFAKSQSDKHDQEIQNIIEQYEQRIQRMQTHYEENEKSIFDHQNREKQLSYNYDCFKNDLNQTIKELIEESETIRENCLQYDQLNENLKQESQKNLKLLLIQLQKINFDRDFNFMNIIKNHILLLHQTILDLKKKIVQNQQIFIDQQEALSEKLEHFRNAYEQEKKEKQKNLELAREQQQTIEIIKLEDNLDECQIEFSKEIKDRDQKIDFLQKELKKNINIQYIKNILIKFFNSEISVQMNTIPAIATVLQFSEQELKQVKENWEKNHSSSFSNFFKIGKNK